MKYDMGKFEGQPIHYDTLDDKFVVTLPEGITVRSASKAGLKRKINDIRKKEFLKVIQARWWAHYGVQLFTKVVKKGKRFYRYDTETGKTKAIKDSGYYLFQFDEEAFAELSQLAEQSKKIEERWDEIRHSLKSLE